MAEAVGDNVFRKDGTRDDFVATHMDYENFDPEAANKMIDKFNAAGLRLSIGAFENLIGGDPFHKVKNQNHRHPRALLIQSRPL